MSENTPFLDESERDVGFEEGRIRLGGQDSRPANSYFKKALRNLSLMAATHSFCLFGLFVGTFVFLKVGPFENTYDQRDSVESLFILHLITTILTAPSFFITFPILLTLVRDLVLSIITIVFSIRLFERAWPGYNMCYRWTRYPEYKPMPQRQECIDAKHTLTILIIAGGASSLILGLLLIITVILRSVALVKSRFWVDQKFPTLSLGKFKNPTGFTVQFSLSILPVGSLPTVVEGQRERNTSSGEREQLIDG